jgi:hypothetical protein
MEINTKYGSIDYEDIDESELSPETVKFLHKRVKTAEMMFTDTIDLTNIDPKFDEIIQELGEVSIAENKFTEASRAFALAEFIDAPLSDIEEENVTSFHGAGGEYKVLTDAEADEEALDHAKSIIDDIGIDGLNDYMKEYIYDNFVSTEWFDEVMNEMNVSTAEDLKLEDADSVEYINRLHEEMVEAGIMDEPEWPDEDDFITGDDGLTPEDEEKFNQAHDEYVESLEKEIDDNFDLFVEKKNEEYDSGIEYYKDNFGQDELNNVITRHNLVNEDKAAEYVVSEGDRGEFLAYYDSEENNITITFKKEKYDYYIYRTG